MDILDCEVLVIGSGAGGATLGNELASNGLKVLILEEGPCVSASEMPTTLSSSFTKLWRNGGLTLASGRSPVAYAEGRCVGGSTEINSAIYQRTSEELLSYWGKKYSIKNFSIGAMEENYDEAAMLVNASLTQGRLGKHSEFLRRAGENKNWQVSPLARGQVKCVGTNHCSIGCPTGAKQSMTNSVLEIFKKNGGNLISDCRVNKIISKGNVVTGATAELITGDKFKKITIRAKHIMVCGGAIQTPALLLRSGFRRGVGERLKLHPTIRVLAEFDECIDAQRTRLPLYAITEFAPDSRLGGSVFTLPTFGMFLAEDWDKRHQMLVSHKNMGMYYAMARGNGLGNVKSIPFSRHPAVSYQLSKDDWSNLKKSLFHLCLALFESGARKIQPSVRGMNSWRSIDEMQKSINHGLLKKNCNLMTIHLFSSVRMGEDKNKCAADSFGKIHDMENLYVSDASLIPESPGVNPQGTVMALALRVAKNFLMRLS